MADCEGKTQIQKEIKYQGDIVRKLKAEKAEKDRVCNFDTLSQN